MNRWLAVVTLFAAVALGVDRLDAANFTVRPMQIVFTPARKTAVITLKNISKQELRFQIRAFTWDQSPRGDMQLDSTKDIVLFPQLLVLGPGQQRPIRLGMSGAIGEVEKAYRVFFEELPPGNGAVPPAVNGVQMRVRVGLPVFASPRNRGTALVTIRNPRQSDGRVTLRVDNSGLSHVVVDAVRVRGLDGGGRLLFERRINGWYLLAKHSTEYAIPLNRGDCSAAALALELLVGKTVVRDRIEGPLTGCP